MTTTSQPTTSPVLRGGRATRLSPAGARLVEQVQRDLLATHGVHVPASRVIEAALKHWLSAHQARPTDGG